MVATDRRREQHDADSGDRRSRKAWNPTRPTCRNWNRLPSRVRARQWEQWQQAAAQSAQQAKDQQTELSRHGDVLLQVLEATGQIINLEQALNQNLRALAGAKNFEDTVMSLSAAIHLLNSRLGKPVARDAQVQLDKLRQERAA